MKTHCPWKKWIQLFIGLACACSMALAATTDWRPRPGAMQPDGDPLDTSPLHWGTWWGDLGQASQSFDTTKSPSNNIAGSVHVIYDCFGGASWNPADPKSANLAFGNFFDSKWGDNGWLGAGNEFDASKYESLEMDIFVDPTINSNLTAIPMKLWGAAYNQAGIGDVAADQPGWQHIVLPIPSSINMANCVGYGPYEWYNTTASTPPAHMEYWFANVKLVARQAPPPPPTLSAKPMPYSGLLFDSGAGEGGTRGSIYTVSSVPWSWVATPASPVTYSMTVGWVPDPALYPEYEANMWLATAPGVGNPDWNLPDVGWLQIHSLSDGSAYAQLVWKTNSAFNNTMFWNAQDGGEYGTNGYGVGLLAELVAPTMVGTWSITFTSDTQFTITGPGGVSTNAALPSEYLNSFIAAAGGTTHAYFGGSPNGDSNAGQPMFLDNVAIGGYFLSNDFSSLPLDTLSWGLLGSQSFIVPSTAAWWLSWTVPAANFDLYSTSDLGSPTEWTQLSGNTNLPVPVSTYASGTNVKAIVPVADLGSEDQSFFVLKKLVASKLQVLLPGETNAPGTATGKIGTPEPQTLGALVPVTVNAVDDDWNIVPYVTDTVSLSSSDATAVDENSAPLPVSAALAGGTQTIYIIFFTSGPQTVTASDTTQPSVTTGTSSSVLIQ